MPEYDEPYMCPACNKDGMLIEGDLYGCPSCGMEWHEEGYGEDVMDHVGPDAYLHDDEVEDDMESDLFVDEYDVPDGDGPW